MNVTTPSSRACAGMAVLLLPLLSACTADTAGPGGTAGPTAAHRLADSKALTLPLDAYLLTTTDAGTLARGRDSLMQRCLAGFGVPYTPKALGNTDIETNERRYGLADAELAKEHGYHVPDMDKRAEDYPSSAMPLVRGDVTTYNGVAVPQGGCIGEVQRGLFEVELQDALDLAHKLNMESYTKSQKAPTVVKATGEWSNCMKGSGHTYPDPLAAINDKEFSGASAGPHEKEVALADVRCKQKVNLIGIWSDAESEYQRFLIESNSSALAGPLLAKQKTMSAAKAATGQ
ncbi:hypothetical protein [Streptomyces xanthophaeus]|uniref:hypothetical protein n=1 Tax=Streptomyces xanthophaeus TaxID=67385 RepID=UPI0026473866|nr:hypothetical protein [Streptomyces xanthophaeus]WKD34873.1 hypothetical protein KO717_25015 [Streptomyces xanthophaeus]